MTKEEYNRLLQSDYWKGFSYSLIKERNFTCEDCGRSFPNQRNMLEVHHLVYRDIYPWSYKPEEMVVLCEECHKKRHGIYINPEHQTLSSNVVDNRKYSNGTYNEAERWGYNNDNKKTYKRIAIVAIILLLPILLYTLNSNTEDKYNVENPVTESKIQEQKQEPTLDNTSSILASPVTKKDASKKTRDEQSKRESVIDESAKEPSTTKEPSTLELLERKSHANAVEAAKRAGVSSEGSTLDIYERISHANAEKAAKRAGVSSEGSTLDIYERISHANAVKAAKRAGVSSEGSTLDIYERISHANAVKAAKRAGVSSEGSTLDIYERISRKQMEKYNY